MMDGTRGDMWVEAKRRDTSMCEWVTMGFFDTYIPYLTLHVVDLSISLLPLSLSLPSSQLHISLFSSCRSDRLPELLRDFLAAASFTPWSRECVRERESRREKYQAHNKIRLPPPPSFFFWWFLQ